MVIWGGALRVPTVTDLAGAVSAEGAAFSPDLDEWRPSPPAPLRARTDHSIVWTGRELIVWGGSSGSAEPPLGLFADGAAYDLGLDRWRSLPAAPVGGRYAHEAVWTGDEMLVWGGITATDGASTEAAAYRPADNRWRRLTDAPLGRTHGQPIWTGRQALSLLAASGNIEDTADLVTYDSASDTWGVVPRPPCRRRRRRVDRH